MPCYNAEEHLSDAIKSIKAQSHENFELILINDGSTDNVVVN
jgi:glycosyltransferase involved in cell wall biosynthesis